MRFDSFELQLCGRGLKVSGRWSRDHNFAFCILHSAFSLLQLCLAGVKLIVFPALVNESLMIALFYDFTVLENNNII